VDVEEEEEDVRLVRELREVNQELLEELQAWFPPEAPYRINTAIVARHRIQVACDYATNPKQVLQMCNHSSSKKSDVGRRRRDDTRRVPTGMEGLIQEARTELQNLRLQTKQKIKNETTTM
jgi:hypothetical protein